MIRVQFGMRLTNVTPHVFADRASGLSFEPGQTLEVRSDCLDPNCANLGSALDGLSAAAACGHLQITE